jgi:hypothetical protein
MRRANIVGKMKKDGMGVEVVRLFGVILNAAKRSEESREYSLGSRRDHPLDPSLRSG